MKLLKTHPFLSLVNSYVIDSPAKCLGKTLFGHILSNSGDTLKLMVPNYSRKIISGWSNYPCTVTSHKMIEREMGNRGSKSGFSSNFVKEQRVDGSRCIIKDLFMHLRYTLMGFERNYQIKIPSNQLNIKYLFLHFSYFKNILFFSILLFSLTNLSDFFLFSDSFFSLSCFVPIKIYHNAQASKSMIFKENKNKTGVYMWVNTKSGRIYIGSALNLAKRFYRYFSVLALKRDGNYICRALLHHTHSAFSLHIIEYIDIKGLSLEEAAPRAGRPGRRGAQARNIILDKEQFYLDIIFSTNKDMAMNKDMGNNINGPFKSVIVYSNAETDRSKILSDLKGRAGIYKWKHLESRLF